MTKIDKIVLVPGPGNFAAGTRLLIEEGATAPADEEPQLTCRACGQPLVSDWVGEPEVGWCSPCGEWQFPEEPE